MTEAMSRRDIEDVLTSIKRLVSQDAQNRPTSETVAPAAARAGKLVLTPALRVTPEPDNPAPAAPIAANDTPADLTEQPAADDTLPVAEHAPGTPAPASYSLIRRISQAGTIPPLPSAPVPDLAKAPAESANFDAFSEDASESVMQSLEDSALEATLARLEAVLSGKPVPSAEVTQADSATETVETSSTARTDDEQIIDEGMLYQLVAHIVRQELQGELGEKITRNIRKLVRQEVAREMQLRQG